MSIIERLYNGEYYPAERTLPSSKKYIKVKEEMHVAYEKLNDQLSKPQQQLLDDYAGKAADAHRQISLEAISIGSSVWAVFSPGITQVGVTIGVYHPKMNTG